MPQNTTVNEWRNEGVCQDCLERELGQWFEGDMGGEIKHLVDLSFGNLPYDGKCNICGRNSFMKIENITPEMMFDCMSEELEFAGAEEESLMEDMLFMN